ncbi:MAG: DUF5684 domain-containing protein [Gemmatimonadales bacterium]
MWQLLSSLSVQDMTQDPYSQMEMQELGATFWLVMLAIAVFFIAVMWKIFTKAGKPGWASIIPIYNLVVWLDIVGKPVWWIILLLIPIVNIFVYIIMYHGLSKAFGKGVGFTLGLIFLGIIFFPILAFGSAQYTRPGPAM